MSKVKLALIASGSGTDAYAIMSAWKQGLIPNVYIRMLISTKTAAGCLRKAEELDIDTFIIDRKSLGRSEFNHCLSDVLEGEGIQLVFLVGCVVKIPAIRGIDFYNIHPADLHACGGDNMYGLEPHKKVLTDIADLVKRGRRHSGDRFFTYPTVHEVNRFLDEPQAYDSGEPLLRLSVEIPKDIIFMYLDKSLELEEAAEKLQKFVLPYEWRMLPLAVSLAARKIEPDLSE